MLLLFFPSTLVVVAMVLHSLKVRGTRETWLFFLFGLLFGVARGNIIWWITTVHFGGRFPYIFTNRLLGIFHDSLQADIGWILTVYLGWCFAERLLARVKGRERSLAHLVSLTALFATALSYAVESTAMALGWWNWNLGVKSRFLVDVPIAGVAAWFSVPIDFFLPFLLMVRMRGRVSAGWRWASLLIFPLHMLVHLSNDRLSAAVPITPFNLFYWVAMLLALVAPLALVDARGRAIELPESTPSSKGSFAQRLPNWIASAVPATSIAIVIGVLLVSDLVIARRPELLYSLAPLMLLTAMVYLPVRRWIVLLAAVGIAFAQPRLLWPLVAVAGLITAWSAEPRLSRTARRAIVLALPVLLSVFFLRDARARDRIDRQYGEACARGAALARRGEYEASIASYEAAIRLRPDQVRALEEVAQVEVQKQDYLRAEATYRKLLQLRPISPELMNNLGNVLVLQGRQAEAIEAYRTALRFDPNYRAARLTLERLGVTPAR